MTDKERIYKYLAGGIKHKSFRKWLLKQADLISIFGKEDALKLNDLIQVYSEVDRIRTILLNHIDQNELDKFSKYDIILKLLKQDKDILETLSELSSFAKRIKDKALLNYIDKLENRYRNIPRLVEKNNWNIDIYN